MGASQRKREKKKEGDPNRQGPEEGTISGETRGLMGNRADGLGFSGSLSLQVSICAGCLEHERGEIGGALPFWSGRPCLADCGLERWRANDLCQPSCSEIREERGLRLVTSSYATSGSDVRCEFVLRGEQGRTGVSCPCPTRRRRERESGLLRLQSSSPTCGRITGDPLAVGRRKG